MMDDYLSMTRTGGDLDHRGGRDVPDVRTELAALATDPGHEKRFRDLWPYLCSEGTTWPAAYAATPYLVDLAASLLPERDGSSRSQHSV